jgi:hypothetical protein
MSKEESLLHAVVERLDNIEMQLMLIDKEAKRIRVLSDTSIENDHKLVGWLKSIKELLMTKKDPQ